jgi:methyl-accepting chemotaxis protein
MKKKWRRRNYFIKKDLQGRYMFIFFVVIIAGIITFAIVFGLLSSDALTILYEQSKVRVDDTPVALLKQLIKAHWLVLISVGVAVVIFSMFLTHRVAGPIYRFERTVDDLIEGNLNFRVRIRKKDEGKELADKFNNLITTYADVLNETKELSDKIEKALGEALKTPQRDELLKEVMEVNRHLREKLEFFKTKQK